MLFLKFLNDTCWYFFFNHWSHFYRCLCFILLKWNLNTFVCYLSMISLLFILLWFRILHIYIMLAQLTTTSVSLILRFLNFVTGDVSTIASIDIPSSAFFLIDTSESLFTTRYEYICLLQDIYRLINLKYKNTAKY